MQISIDGFSKKEKENFLNAPIIFSVKPSRACVSRGNKSWERKTGQKINQNFKNRILQRYLSKLFSAGGLAEYAKDIISN